MLALGLTVAVAALAFTLSAAAGMGGSLLLVPALMMLLGAKQGVATAALLLGANNVLKVVAYRRSLPWRDALLVVVALAAGSLVGARVLVAAPPGIVVVGVILMIGLSFRRERTEVVGEPRRRNGVMVSILAGVLSGVSGTSGPLKGVALRGLGLGRQHLVGAAALAGLFSDVAKTGVFLSTGLLSVADVRAYALLMPVMLVCVMLGRYLNRVAGERRFAALFWAVMAEYSARLVLALV